MIIRKATKDDKKQISKIRPTVYKNMLEYGLNQWDDEYPSNKILFDDIDNGTMYVATIDDLVAGYITVNENISEEYKDVDLRFDSKICVHRLSVNPVFARQGVATRLMKYIHQIYKEAGYTSICLDTCEDNYIALKLYQNLGYSIRGYVVFNRRRQYRFSVMEIEL